MLILEIMKYLMQIVYNNSFCLILIMHKMFLLGFFSSNIVFAKNHYGSTNCVKYCNVKENNCNDIT